MWQRQRPVLDGAGYERLIVTAEVVGNINTITFILIVRKNAAHRSPNFLCAPVHIDFSDDAQYAAKLDELTRVIHQMPAVVRRFKNDEAT